MHKDLDSTCVALEALGTAVTTAWGADTTVCEGIGWFAPALTRHDLANLASVLASDLRSTGLETLDGTVLTLVQDLPRRLQVLQSTTVPQMFGGNGGQAIPAYIATISILRTTLLPALGWQALPDPNSLPSSLARRARAAQAELDQLTPNIGNLSEQINQIQSAHAVADSLPIDLQALADARDRLTKASTESAILSEKIKEAHEASSVQLEKIQSANDIAAKLVQQCEAAYHITTTKGLAGAFDQRAGQLARSMWIWVGGLVIALGVGALIGTHRIEVLSASLQVPNPDWSAIATHAVLSLLSVGAPLWFAWLATKQIGQRFRLAEDYAFKASVAKAYEGYRKEAARIDPAFEAQLLASALTRLDEPPLRLVETSTHGSPWHELANSDAVRRTFAAAPELQEKFSASLREALNATVKAARKSERPPFKAPDPTS